jgi:hypothetical protein
MDENNWEVSTLQAMLNYYRTKSYQLEYEFILYKATNEKRVRELSLELEKLYSGKHFEDSSKKTKTSRKSNAKNDKNK